MANYNLSNMAHTPGEWHASRSSVVVSDHIPQDYSHDAIDYYGGCLIAESVAPRDVNLIAAAPDLLKLAEEFRTSLQKSGITYDNAPLYNRINNAIKKATQTT